MELERFIRDVPDFPKPGIIFKDLSPLWNDAAAFRTAVEALAAPFRGQKVDRVASPDARGFIMGAPVALKLSAGFVVVRKSGKLPWKTRCIRYELEYGADMLCVHEDAFREGDRVLLVDDLLATGGTMVATRQLVEQAGAHVIGAAFLVELCFLRGAEKLQLGDRPLVSLIKVN